MTRNVAFTAVYEAVEDGWVQARVRELPEVITVAPSQGEARELLLDALWEYLQSLGGDAPALDEAAMIGEEPLAIELSA